MESPEVNASKTKCWCGRAGLEPFSDEYLRCSVCASLVLKEKPSSDITHVKDEGKELYSKDYYLSHLPEKYGYPDFMKRARMDLPERCLYWLRSLLKYKLPPSKVLELGSAHGGFIAMLSWAGFEATGLELSPAIVDFAKRTFSVPMLLGPVEDQGIEQGTLDVIVLMDVLEHFPEPVATMRHCLNLLKPDGLLLIQTPRFPENKSYEQLKEKNDSFLLQLKGEEHLYLFSKSSIAKLFNDLGARYLVFEDAIFSHYDMFLVVSRAPLKINTNDEIESTLMATPGSRLIQAMLDIYQSNDFVKKECERIDADRAARLEVIKRLEIQLKESETDRAARLEVIKRLEIELRESESDRSARLEVIKRLEAQLRESELDRAARLEVIENLSAEGQVKDQMIEKHEKELEEFKTSISWKVTALLRRIKAKLK